MSNQKKTIENLAEFVQITKNYLGKASEVLGPVEDAISEQILPSLKVLKYYSVQIEKLVQMAGGATAKTENTLVPDNVVSINSAIQKRDVSSLLIKNKATGKLVRPIEME
jgi:hypothetical protein